MLSRQSNQHPVNPFDDTAIATDYEKWYSTTGKRTDRLEKSLLKRILSCFPTSHTLLEVGCGTGHFTRWFAEQDLFTAGVDISQPMLTEAKRLGASNWQPEEQRRPHLGKRTPVFPTRTGKPAVQPWYRTKPNLLAHNLI